MNFVAQTFGTFFYTCRDDHHSCRLPRRTPQFRNEVEAFELDPPPNVNRKSLDCSATTSFRSSPALSHVNLLEVRACLPGDWQWFVEFGRVHVLFDDREVIVTQLDQQVAQAYEIHHSPPRLTE